MLALVGLQCVIVVHPDHTHSFLCQACYLSNCRMNKPTHKRNTDIVASIKPDLPKRPLTKEPSEHVYLELQGMSHLG